MGRRLLCRALGDAQFKMGKGDNLVECTPEVRRIEMQRGDVGVILASDGLWDVLSDSAAVNVLEEVRALLLPVPPTQHACWRAVALARASLVSAPPGVLEAVHSIHGWVGLHACMPAASAPDTFPSVQQCWLMHH